MRLDKIIPVQAVCVKRGRPFFVGLTPTPQAEKLSAIEAERAKRRQATSGLGIYGGKPLVANLPQAVDAGKTRDKVAEAVGGLDKKGQRVYNTCRRREAWQRKS